MNLKFLNETFGMLNELILIYFIVFPGVLMHEMDTNVLFEKFTIAEIQGIEKKTRSDIEKKKEDLRLMVG